MNLLNVERCNVNTTWVQIETVCAPSLEAPNHVIAISEAKNQQKVDNFRYISVITNINEKKYVFFEHTTTTFIMVIFIYFALDKIFPFFFPF